MAEKYVKSPIFYQSQIFWLRILIGITLFLFMQSAIRWIVGIPGDMTCWVVCLVVIVFTSLMLSIVKTKWRVVFGIVPCVFLFVLLLFGPRDGIRDSSNGRFGLAVRCPFTREGSWRLNFETDRHNYEIVKEYLGVQAANWGVVWTSDPLVRMGRLRDRMIFHTDLRSMIYSLPSDAARIAVLKCLINRNNILLDTQQVLLRHGYEVKMGTHQGAKQWWEENKDRFVPLDFDYGQAGAGKKYFETAIMTDGWLNEVEEDLERLRANQPDSRALDIIEYTYESALRFHEGNFRAIIEKHRRRMRSRDVDKSND